MVTVVIPTYNSARFLPAALASVFEQDPAPGEVLVVDDGSTDETRALLAREPRVTVLVQAHGGVAQARNAGIGAARGDIVAFLDSDDLWPQGRLAAALRVFEARPEVQLLLGREMLFAEPGAAVARREAFDRVGLFDPSYESGEDTEWLLRARQAGVTIERMPDVVVRKRLHGGNLSVETFHRRKETIARIARESIRRRKESRA